jgi:hypothetical protein
MKRIAAIFFCLLIVVAPALALAPDAAVGVKDSCETCACETKTCCAGNSDSESPTQPAAPVTGGKRSLSPVSAPGASVDPPAVTELEVFFAQAVHDSSKSSAAPLYVWNCAYLI